MLVTNRGQRVLQETLCGLITEDTEWYRGNIVLVNNRGHRVLQITVLQETLCGLITEDTEWYRASIVWVGKSGRRVAQRILKSVSVNLSAVLPTSSPCIIQTYLIPVYIQLRFQSLLTCAYYRTAS